MNELTMIALNGSDSFMLAMDRSMRRAGSRGNICHLLVTLPSHTDLDTQCSRLITHETFRSVTSLRLSQHTLRSSRWISRGAPTTSPTTSLDCQSERDLHTLILARTLDSKKESPFGVVFLPRFERGPSLLFYWHHALCDAHGAEQLITSLSVDDAMTLSLSDEPCSSRKQRLIRARETTRMIFTKAQEAIARLPSPARGAQAPRFHKIAFNVEETRRIDATIHRLTGGMFPTAVYLAATVRAVATATSMGNSADEAFFIPVPHDARRTSRQRSPLSNQISMAFFRISTPLRMSLVEATNVVIEQLHETIAKGYQHGILDFLNLIRRLPPSLIWRIIESPTKGHPASLYLSDIGASLSRLEVFGGESVVYATHYPPVLSPPGLTTVWSRYRDLIEVTICFDEAMINTDSIARISEYLRDELTRNTCES